MDDDKINSKISHVGMIIHSTKLDTMAKVIAIYGGINWKKIEGRFLLGQSSAYAINSTGSEAAHTLIINEMPSHSHRPTGWSRGVKGDSEYYALASGTTDNWWRETTYTGGGAAHNNMPPYKVVYI